MHVLRDGAQIFEDVHRGPILFGLGQRRSGKNISTMFKTYCFLLHNNIHQLYSGENVSDKYNCIDFQP